VSGRSRLPRTESDFENEKFQVTDFNTDGRSGGGNMDGYLPRAHTCFFSLELPKYSSKDILRSKLLTAIHGGFVEEL
jgi:HECT-domain (ubiquitin-transferase)